jgi:uncharacterized protein YggT (Ycf19 family)
MVHANTRISATIAEIFLIKIPPLILTPGIMKYMAIIVLYGIRSGWIGDYFTNIGYLIVASNNEPHRPFRHC